ncbi:cytochrome c biogenesis CcdA family protein [Salibacterium halotolerans]|uniref:Cytochrome c-type biogenesis protein n=1 Tax=Salibacterium halotolerans TaxID=1884432 RepID=A0A1I5UPJ4_9BACI|nr:cytochrome c biogenesis protein CcdA [Salibacterium halotolerans]SFP97203.1 cytochrome c-type biogenesis protein [Salibacterium halotolerans]
MNEVTIWLALGAGIISFLSPCVFPLVPAYLAQLTGTTASQNKIKADQRLILLRSLGFIMGFTIIFMLLGASSTFIGQLFSRYNNLVAQIGGIIIVLFGLQMAGVLSIRSLMSEKKLSSKPKKTNSFGGSVMFGLLFAAGWSPCVGLVLGSILTLASQGETMFSGMAMLFIYSVGMGIPFLLVAIFYSKSLHKLRRFHKLMPRIQKAGGIVMIIMGVMLFFGYFQMLSSYLAQFVPFSI